MRARSGGGGQHKLFNRPKLSMNGEGRLGRKDNIMGPPLPNKDAPVEFPGLMKPTLFVVAVSSLPVTNEARL